jgi:hydroxymethylbilane synthase
LPFPCRRACEGGRLKLSGQILSGDGALHLEGDIVITGADDAAALARRLLDEAPVELRALFAA